MGDAWGVMVKTVAGMFGRGWRAWLVCLARSIDAVGDHDHCARWRCSFCQPRVVQPMFSFFSAPVRFLIFLSFFVAFAFFCGIVGHPFCGMRVRRSRGGAVFKPQFSADALGDCGAGVRGVVGSWVYLFEGQQKFLLWTKAS